MYLNGFIIYINIYIYIIMKGIHIINSLVAVIQNLNTAAMFSEQISSISPADVHIIL